MTLEGVCLEQQDIIAKQSAIISGLLRELALHRALDAEELRLMECEGPTARDLLREGDAHL